MLLNYFYRNSYEVLTEDDKYVIKVYAPGLEKDKFELSTEDKTLTVHYPKQLHKQFELPNHKEITSEYRDGILYVNILKGEKNLIKVL